jgi:hypothetical protein
MSPEDRLASFLSEDAAPARPTVDAVFVAEVLQKVARRELGVKLASGATTALAAGAVLWACSPVLNLAVGALGPALAPTASVLVLVATVTLLGGQMLSRR